MAPASNTLRQFLSHVDPFRVLPPKELDQLVRQSREKSFSKGTTIYSEGDPADSVWVLRDGRIQIFKYTTTGRPLAIESIASEELFGTLCRIGGNGRTYPCTAIAATECTVVQISDVTFLDFYKRFPAVVLGVCALCSQRLNNVRDLSCQGQETVEKRIAMTLLQLHKQHGNVLPFTKREISELAGTAVETAIRTMSGFTKKGWVTAQRGKITLKTTEALQKLIDTSC